MNDDLLKKQRDQSIVDAFNEMRNMSLDEIKAELAKVPEDHPLMPMCDGMLEALLPEMFDNNDANERKITDMQ